MTKKLLVLDLDETLIHANEIPLRHKPDFLIGNYHVYERPFVRDFIVFCLEHFNVAIWTTATAPFAESVTDHLFENQKDLKFVWCRDSCTQVYDYELGEHGYIKKLAKVKKKGFDLDHVLMIDDTPSKLKLNYGNLVRVSEFTGDKDDEELLILMKYLEYLKDEDNIRKIEKRGWQYRY